MNEINKHTFIITKKKKQITTILKKINVVQTSVILAGFCFINNLPQKPLFLNVNWLQPDNRKQNTVLVINTNCKENNK